MYFRRKRWPVPVTTPIEPNQMLFIDADGEESQTSQAARPAIPYARTLSLIDPATPIPTHPALSNISGHTSQLGSQSSGDFSTSSVVPTNVALFGDARSDNISECDFPISNSTYNRTLTRRTSLPHTNEHLTDDQVDFVHTLYRHNIPARSVARVMERMIEGQERDGLQESVAGLSNRSSVPTTLTAPPSYAP
jgi:hypothetical protein